MSELLKVGDIIEIKKGHKVYTDIPMHFVFSNKKGCFDIIHYSVKINNDTSYLEGIYKVYEISFDGGGWMYACGGHGNKDIYDNGHHVWCINDEGRKIDFYQTGSFTAMIEDIKPINKNESDKV